MQGGSTDRTADRTKILPLRELLQKFHGASYITSLDLSSAFLKVPLKETSRLWAAFQFQSKVSILTLSLMGLRTVYLRLLGHWKRF
jgi:hypothetical protein